MKICTHAMDNGECGKEIIEYGHEYCEKHMNLYSCDECGHSPRHHPVIDNERKHCVKCKCEQFKSYDFFGEGY